MAVNHQSSPGRAAPAASSTKGEAGPRRNEERRKMLGEEDGDLGRKGMSVGQAVSFRNY